MKIVVIYSSHYGYTKKYAEWIAEGLKADLCEKSKVKPMDLTNYDVIIYGGGLYAGGVNGISLLTKNWDKIKNKKIIVFTVGLADPQKEENTASIYNSIGKVFSEDAKKHIKFFHFRGGIDYSKLSFIHKPMMAMLKKVINKKDESELTDEDKGLLETYGKKVDFTNKDSIAPLIEYVKG